MGKNAFLAVFFLFMIVPDVCDASLLSKFRKLVGAVPKDSSIPSSPSPSPVPSNNKSSTKPADGSTNNEPEPPVPKKSTQVDSMGGTTQKKKDEQKTNDSLVPSTDKCIEPVDVTCNDRGSMTACIKNYQRGSKELLVLVLNGGGSALKVNLTVESNSTMLDIPKHHTERTNISLTDDKSSKLILNAGNGVCELPVGPPVGANFYVRLPSFHKLVTPVNGAYFLILTVLVFGGTWACCKLRKRRHPGGVPYQELEMGLPESVSATNVETAEGWDQGWDDDWDENNAVKSQGLVGSISANGLTSRSSNRDGWENDWND
ncbi:uncharacterized protein LOC121264834 isoform X1 [Juglans microcarpa x Juglans regia]|uniref:uncharacterized protein LOC121264834 isoform X1 n=2 Tax=Juglans microcarpa x Juglans regia TaxID=2249226 RepID=UPI001B7EB946|nr:uncharacterized protein LOC121264834 isoform X1 [Juglans microcarpa x Juglans regia]